MKKHIITIAGTPGSGKSSAAAGIAGLLGYEHFSSGDLFRKMAAEQGISIEEMNFAAEKKKEIDREVDESLVHLGKERENFVIDSRTSSVSLDAGIVQGFSLAGSARRGPSACFQIQEGEKGEPVRLSLG